MKWYEKKYFFGWGNWKKFFKDIYATFSNKPSELSSKRLERFALFSSALYCFHVWFQYHYKNLDYLEVIAVIGMLLGYAGFTLYTTQKEKRTINKKSEES